MHEKQKLREARYFLSVAFKELKNPGIFKFNLSAFLTAARSVMQYAKKEIGKKRGGQKWYDNRMSTSPILSYFKDKRDFNIHIEPLGKHIKAIIPEVVLDVKFPPLQIFDKERELTKTEEKSKKPKPTPKIENREDESALGFLFEDWQGWEDGISLCLKYIVELEKVVEGGISKGFISG